MAQIRGGVRSRAGAVVLAIAACVVVAGGCSGRPFGKVYEYEEDLFLAMDGSAEVIVNTSIPALVALRGVDLPVDPVTRLDREKIRALYTSPLTEVSRVSRPWRRYGRRFVQIRLRVSDVRKLSQVPPFSWATYEFAEKDDVMVYKQTIGASAHRPGTLQNVGWAGGELFAIRLHMPSKIVWHNARDIETNETSDIARGNILAWEQHLTDRLDGRPIAIEVRMDRQSILNRTLWLFAGAFTAAVLLLSLLVWWTVRKGAKDGQAA